MRKTLLCFVSAIAYSGGLHAQSCLLVGTIFGKPTKECLTNVSMPRDGFDNLCTAWDKHPVPGIENKTTYVDSCPAGFAGYCVTTFAGSASSMKHYFYNSDIVARAKKSCSAQNPISSGVWHDQ